MVSALDSGSSGLGSRPGRGHCIVFMGKTLNSRGEQKYSQSLHAMETGISSGLMSHQAQMQTLSYKQGGLLIPAYIHIPYLRNQVYCGTAVFVHQIINDNFSNVLFSVFQALLELVHDIFEEQTSLDKVVHKIMRRALTMLKCERCSVLLLMHPVLGNSLAEDRAQVSNLPACKIHHNVIN